MPYERLAGTKPMAVWAVLGCQDIHAPVVERTNAPTPAATQATLDGRTALAQKFL